MKKLRCDYYSVIVGLFFSLFCSICSAEVNGYLRYKLGSKNVNFSSSMENSNEISQPSLQTSSFEAKLSFPQTFIPEIEVAYHSSDSFIPDTETESTLDDSKIGSFLVYLGTSSGKKPKLSYESFEMRGIYEVNGTVSGLNNGDLFELSNKVEKFGLTWGVDQRLNYDDAENSWMLGLSYYKSESTYLLSGKYNYNYTRNSEIETDTFHGLAIDFNTVYASGLGTEGWFFSIGPDIDLILGDVLGLKGGYFSSIGYSSESGFAGILTIQGNVLDVMSIRTADGMYEEADFVVYGGLSHEILLGVNYSF